MKTSLQRANADGSKSRFPFVTSSFLQNIKTWLVPPHSSRHELLDQLNIPALDLAANFRDISFINRWFGGIYLVEKSLRPLLPAPGAEIKLLDIAAGVADVPLALAKRWSNRYRVSLTAVELNPAIAELAKEAAQKAGINQFEAIAADVFTYDFGAENQPPYDFVTCSLAFHHFSREQCLEMLGLMARLSGRGFVVNDLERSWFGYLGAHLLGLTFTRHYLTRHDGPLSVLRSSTPAEFAQLVKEAALPPEFKVQIKKGPFSRLAIVGTRV